MWPLYPYMAFAVGEVWTLLLLRDTPKYENPHNGATIKDVQLVRLVGTLLMDIIIIFLLVGELLLLISLWAHCIARFKRWRARNAEIVVREISQV